MSLASHRYTHSVQVQLRDALNMSLQVVVRKVRENGSRLRWLALFSLQTGHFPTSDIPSRSGGAASARSLMLAASI